MNPIVFKNDAPRHDALVRMLGNLASRLPANDLELLKRIIINAQVSPSSDGPLLDFMTFVNPNMAQEQFDKVVTGFLANATQLMASSEGRLKPDAVKLAPSLGSPVPNLTLTQGDIDDLEVNSGTSPLPQSVYELKDQRRQIKEQFHPNSSEAKYIKRLAIVLLKASQRSKDESVPIMQAISDAAADMTNKGRIELRQKQSFYQPVNRKSTAGTVGEGALPAVTIGNLLAAGKVIIDVGMMLYSVYKLFVPSSSVSKPSSVPTNYSPNTLYEKIELKFKALGLPLTDFKAAVDKLKKEALLRVGPEYSSSAASEWTDLHLQANLKYLLNATTKSLQIALANAYKKANPEKESVYKFLTPPPEMPVESLLSTVWDPELLRSETIVYDDMLQYNIALEKYEPTSKLNFPFDKAELFSGKNKFALMDTNSKDGWDDVTKYYLIHDYAPMMSRFVDNLRIALHNAALFGRDIAKNYPLASKARVFPNVTPDIKPWDKTSMAQLVETIKSVHLGEKAKSSSTVNPSNSENKSGGSSSYKLDMGEEQSDNIEIKAQGSSSGFNSSDGTILVTPNETIVNLGHYIDPKTGAISDFSDLYAVGKAITDTKSRADLLMRVPNQTAFIGDIDLEGSLLGIAAGIAGKLGKKLLNSKIGKKLATKIPILKNLIEKAPESINKVANTSLVSESKAADLVTDNAHSLPSSPTQFTNAIAAVHTLEPLLRGMDAKLDTALDVLNQVKIKIFTPETIKQDAIADVPVYTHTAYESNTPVSYIDALSYASDPQLMLTENSDSSSLNSDVDTYVGDIDLWRVLI